MSVPLFLDCDTGIDDALTLAYLLRHPGVDLVGIGTVGGNIEAAQAAHNTLALLQLDGRIDIPVAIGSTDPLIGTFGGGAPQVHGADGVGGVPLPAPDASPVAGSAAEALVRAARAHPGELRVLAIGPCTNLALALQEAPDLAGLVHSVTVMGGAVLGGGNVTSIAEANIHNDPEAAAAVLSAAWKVTLVPLDLTLQHRFTEADCAALAQAGAPAVVAISAMVDFYLDFYATRLGVRECALHDPLAAAVAIDDVRAVIAHDTHVVVDTSDGPHRGATVADRRARSDGPLTRVVLGVDAPFGPLLLSRLMS
ncbi:nucleoside hydrolase [Nocardioides cavernaquae]|uniref:Nucleoside hydrolase n=1 Tax=Nocardioides cavernaquae TaxID=2321396 RepID=A0A3A5HFM2_9ACTN|nr:nucleoside hydrolase [Nocardioides cavernaquae]RJS46587.1 nucleoside hydrolase [Nocardioides cavernaquae]